MKRELEAVIFDLDGVIVDTVDLYFQANKRVAEELGLSFTKLDNEKFRGIGRMEIIEALTAESGADLAPEEKKRLADQKNEHYQELIHTIDERAILPGLKGFIEEIKASGLGLALASSSTNGRTVLQKTGLFHHFDSIVDPSALSKGKPDPEIFIKAAAALGIPHRNCAAIEDGEAGLKAIQATKMFSVGVGEAEGMETADWYVRTTTELMLHELRKRFEG